MATRKKKPDTKSKSEAKKGGDAPEPHPDDDLLTSLADGEVLFKEGDAGDSMFIVESGEVEIFKGVGDRERRLALVGEGDFFGEMAVLEEMPRSATARAVGTARVLEIDGATLDRMLEEQPQLAVRVMRRLSSRLRDVEREERRVRKLAAGVLAGAAHGEATRQPIVPSATSAPPPEPSASFDDEASVILEPVAHSARFLHRASGKVFPVGDARDVLIGRFDPSTGKSPDIDLESVDTQRSLSRRHARLSRRKGRYSVREEGVTANGSWVAGERLKGGDEREVRHGDTVRFGMVELVFRFEPEL